MGRGDRCSVKTRKSSKNADNQKQPAAQKKISKKIQNLGDCQQALNTCPIKVNKEVRQHNGLKTRQESLKKILSQKQMKMDESNIKMHGKDASLCLIEEDTSNSTQYSQTVSPRMNGMSISTSNHSNEYQSQHNNAKSPLAFQKGCIPCCKQNTRSNKQITESLPHHSQQKILYSSINEDPKGLNPCLNPRMRSPADYASFMEVPCVYPTEEEFNDPYTLFTMLHQQGYAKHGIVKIIPPKTWKPEYSFDKIKEKVTTRTQVLAELSQGQNTDSNTYKDFKKMAEDFKKTYNFSTKTNLQNEYRKIEYEFWEHVEHPELFKDELEVEYAADLPSKKYGSAFSFMDNMTNSSFNLNNINSIKNSLFQHFSKDNNGISGISNPWIYLGMMFASFCWHVEDLYMCALNYLHMGEAKTWYGIPPEYKYRFEDVYKKTYPHIFEKKPDVLFHINLMLSPAIAVENGIPVYRTDQKAGEFIFTFPKTYHAGFSHGFNCGEAVNVITFDWFQNYKEAVEYYQTIKHPTKNFFKSASFAIEWLISQVVYNLDTTSFDNPTILKIKDEQQKIVHAEEEKRKQVLEKYGEENVKVYEFSNKKERYDRHVCWQCGYYSYYSYLFCNTCIKKSCLNHDKPCKCNKIPQLFIRYTLQDFDEQSKLIENKLKQNSSSSSSSSSSS